MSYTEHSNLVDSEIYLYLLINKETFEVMDGNRSAKNYYFSGSDTPHLFDLFEKAETLRNPLMSLELGDSIRLYGLKSRKITGEIFVSDLEICYTSAEEKIIFMVVKDRAKDQDRHLSDLVELVDNPVFVFQVEPDFPVRYGNYKFYQSIRCTKDSFKTKYNNAYSNLLDTTRRVALTTEVSHQLDLSQECNVDIEVTYDGEYFHLFRLNGFQSELDGCLYGVLISIRNQSGLMKKIEYDHQYIEIIQEFSRDLLFRVDIRQGILLHTGDISGYLGLSSTMLQYPDCMRDNPFVHPEDVEGYVAFAQRMIHGQSGLHECRLQLANGNYEMHRLQGKPLFNEEGKPVQIIGKIENIQEWTMLQEMAFYDSKTATLSGDSFRDMIQDQLQRAVQRDRFALLYLKFDDFIGLNDKMGREFSDFVLKVAGKRIINSTRNLDRVGRLGDDGFLIFFHHAPTEKAVLERAETVLQSLRRKFNDGDITYSLLSSIGIALYPEHGKTLPDLMDKAERALAQCYCLGKDVAKVYNDD